MISVIFGVICGNLFDLDICFLVILIEKLYVFFLVIWGMVFDVDIELEKYRCLGEIRFFIGVIVKIIGLRKYRGRILYLLVDYILYGGENNLVFNFSYGEVVCSSILDVDNVSFLL